MRGTIGQASTRPRRKAKNNRIITPEYLDESVDLDVSMFDYFVGIDPSFSSTGVVILDREGNTVYAAAHAAGKPNMPFYERLEILLDKIDAAMVQLSTDKVFVVMEGAAFASEFNVFKLGKLSGVLEYYLGTSNYQYSLVAPTFAKKVATGKGAASKNEVIAGVRMKWGFESSSSDINDAYVMAQIARGARPTTKKTKKRG